MQLPHAEVASSDAYLELLPHDSFEDFSDDGLSHLLLLAEAEALHVLLKGHRQEEEAEDLVVVELSHVQLHSSPDKQASYLLFNAL